MEKVQDTLITKKVKYHNAQIPYDQCSVSVLSDKGILALILQSVTEEFKDIDLETIRTRCIEGEIEIQEELVEPGFTNSEHINPDILGINTDCKIPGEGENCFDILFNAYANKNNERVKLIINLESQKTGKESKLKYPLESRQVFYTARMLSAQYGREFKNSRYGDIKKVISIWICLDQKEEFKDTIIRTQMNPKCIYGNAAVNDDMYDLIDIVTINVDTKKAKGENDLMALLSVLFGNADVETKIEKLEQCGIAVSEKVKGGVSSMCNLSQAIADENQEIGIAKGKILAFLELFEEGSITEEQFSAKAGCSTEDARKMLN